MNPLILLGIAAAFLALTGKKNVPAPNGLATQPGTPTEPDPIAPTFNSVPLTTKSKTPTTLGSQVVDDSSQLIGISPPAEGDSPPYVYDLVSGGPCGTGWLGTMDSPAESFAAVPPPAE